MKVKIVSRKLIKPSTSTPQNLNKYKISLIDELMPPINVGVILFYPSKVKDNSLEESLAQTLARFYPLAGRYIKNDHLVDCSDQGAELVKAEAEDIDDVELINVVGKLKVEQLYDLIPQQTYPANEAATDPILSIQVTEFKCGGLVIGVSVSHKIFDMSSLATFISAWSNANNINPGPEAEGKISINPIFNSSSLFPGKNLDFGPDFDPDQIQNPESVCIKRFLFSKEAITSLRSKLKPNHGNKSSRILSRVRVVCAVIAKALIGVDRAKYRKSRPCLISQLVNIRERTIPPLHKHSCGNLAIASHTRIMTEVETQEMGIQELVDVIGGGIDQTIADCAEILSLGEDGLNKMLLIPAANVMEKLKSGEVYNIWCTDWSKFGFYEADFGSGKPVWVTIKPERAENITILMDTKESDGIEAWVHLKSSEMIYFEQDEDIKIFTT